LRRPLNEKSIRWLMIMRVAVTATLLISAFGIELLFAPSESLFLFYVLCGATFALVLGYALVYPLMRDSAWFLAAQIFGDLLAVTGFVYLTGGVASPMSFLYFVPIITASVLLLRRGGMASAACASTLYIGLALGNALGWLPPYPRTVRLDVELDSRHIMYSILNHLVGFFLAAIFTSYLSEKLRRTDRELAEKQSDLDELKALNENIVESINSGLVTTDLGGRVTFVNPGAGEILATRRADMVGRAAAEVFGMSTAFIERVKGILDRERRFRFEKPFHTPDGRERFLGMAVSILRDREHRALGYIFIFQDLTEINALERQVRLKERMAALGEMAAGMAHELRNPLASISGSVQVLKQELRPVGEQLELMDIILRESERLDQTIRDFLTFAKPGRFTPEIADVVALLQSSAKLMRNSRELRTGHELKIESSRPEIWCSLDVNRMKQVFWNLATNALKAMPDGGTLTLRVRDQENGVEIAFCDEGIGMTEEDLERYFQPFRGGFVEGTGLGAAIVYRIVEEHGGAVSLRSRPGRGTEVLISLPATRPEPVTIEDAEPAPAMGAGPRASGWKV
jgi:two-component system sensor histidine kinase PilS (NtrC family)